MIANMPKSNNKRRAEEDPDLDLGNDDAELEITNYEDMNVDVARDNPNVRKLRISCFLKCTHRRGYPAHGMRPCHETAARIPSFLSLFPKIVSVELGGYSTIIDDKDPKPFFFHLTGQAIRRVDDESVSSSITVIFNLVNALCAAYRTGALSSRAKIDLFGPPQIHSRHNLFCADKLDEESATAIDAEENQRDGKTCEVCRTVCRSINLEQAMALRCSEGDGDNYVGRIEFQGYQLCLTSKTKFEIISERPGATALFRTYLLGFLADPESVRIAWYTCDKSGQPEENGKFRSGMIRYARGYSDGAVTDELTVLFALLKDDVKSSDIVSAIASNERANIFMINETIYITEGTWIFLEVEIDSADRNKFRVIDMEKYCCYDEDMTLSREYWRDEI